MFDIWYIVLFLFLLETRDVEHFSFLYYYFSKITFTELKSYFTELINQTLMQTH